MSSDSTPPAKPDENQIIRNGVYYWLIAGLLFVVGAWIRWSIYLAVNRPDSVQGRAFLDKLYTQEDPLFGGGHFYRAMAIVNGSGFLTADDFVDPPGTTFTLATLFGSGFSPALVQVLWCLAGIAAMVVGWLGLRHWLPKKWQLVGLLFLVVDVSAASYGAYLTGEVPAMLLFGSGMYLVSLSMKLTSVRSCPAADNVRAVRMARVGGILIGLSTLFWSMGLGVVLGVFLLGLVSMMPANRLTDGLFAVESWRQLWRKCALGCLGVITVLSMATYLITGRFGVTNLGNPYRFFISHIHEPRMLTFENPETGRATTVGLTFAYQRRAVANLKFPFGPSNHSFVWQESEKVFVDRPVEFVNQSLVNAMNLFSGNLGWPNFTSPVRQAVEFGEVAFLYLVILPLGALVFIPGIFTRDYPRDDPRDDPKDPRSIFMLLILSYFVFGMFHPPEVRFRVPFDAVIVTAALVLARSFLRSNRQLKKG